MIGSSKNGGKLFWFEFRHLLNFGNYDTLAFVPVDAVVAVEASLAVAV